MEQKLTHEQKKQAVQIAIDGGDPLEFLAKCGSANPVKMWGHIRSIVKEKDPELFAKIPDRRVAKKTPAHAPTVKLSGPIRIETPEANKVEIVETPEKEKEKEFGLPAYINGFEIIGIRGQFGTYRASSEYNYFEFVPFGGELCMNPGDWREQLEELQKAAKVLGVKL